MQAYEKIARILRTDKDNLTLVSDCLRKKTGKEGILEEIESENQNTIKDRLSKLNLSKSPSAKEIFDALIYKIDKDDKELSKALGNPVCSLQRGCEVIGRAALDSVSQRKDFFLKKEKFIDLLRANPPQKILSALNYKNVDEMLAKENWMEIACALRFLEGMDWMNSVFIKSYSDLVVSDFEYRDLEIISLDEKWQKLADNFEHKKYHNISHLKELGIIFIIPVSLEVPGEMIRTLALLFHYVNELKFYSSVFEDFSKKENFSQNIISLLRGDVIDGRNILKKGDWLIIQRYLAKDDENDWRLFEPHVNPEAIHWEKAEKMIVELGKRYGLEDDFSFWRELNWIGDYFTTETGIEVLVSFNLIDTSMSLVKKRELVKYLYHHQESLWNKIFSSYFGEEEMERIIKENIITGKISFDCKF